MQSKNTEIQKEFQKQYIIIPSKRGFILSTRPCHLSLSMAHRNPCKYMMQKVLEVVVS
jgi:hypothetical protein